MQQPPEVTYCELCSNSDQLWMCLICGQKYCEVHNQQHYQSTQHALQMNVDTKLVFDHASMNFVHRILINELDGKLVQMQDGKCKDSGAKLTEYLEEQNQIFTQSLESQRVYF
jgi:BRCA1-associated protein